jgi:hypothetical protein
MRCPPSFFPDSDVLEHNLLRFLCGTTDQYITRRRMMSLSTHDRIGGTPQMVKVLDEFLKYAARHKGVWFARKDQIARFALETAGTVREA